MEGSKEATGCSAHVLSQSMAQKCDVLARRQMPLHVEAPQVTKLLTDYGKSRVEELKNGKDITPELMRRMKMLVSQDWWATRLKSFKIFS